ncbi:MAG: class I SAM-dependent methyltransferase [Thermodesulfobacteriota bacterium]
MPDWDERYSTNRSPQKREPANLLVDLLPTLPGGKALDLACGEGRNAFFLAGNGYSVDGIDSSQVVIERDRVVADEEGVAVNFIHADLEAYTLPPSTYDLIVNFYYLQRSLIPSMKAALKSGGVILFETYTIDQVEIGPQRNRAYLLQPNELLKTFGDFHLLFYREGIVEEGGRKAIASLAARKI